MAKSGSKEFTREDSVRTLISEVKIQQRVKELASQIDYDFQGKDVVVICTLKGSFIFYSDLIRNLEIPITCEFLGLSSYGNSKATSGEVKVTLDVNEPLQDRHILVVEDIVDTGLTLKYILTALGARNPASIRTCALLQKPDALQTSIEVDYVGFKIGNEFVVGYGLDYMERHRELPFVGCLENEH